MCRKHLLRRLVIITAGLLSGSPLTAIGQESVRVLGSFSGTHNQEATAQAFMRDHPDARVRVEYPPNTTDQCMKGGRSSLAVSTATFGLTPLGHAQNERAEEQRASGRLGRLPDSRFQWSGAPEHDCRGKPTRSPSDGSSRSRFATRGTGRSGARSGRPSGCSGSTRRRTSPGTIRAHSRACRTGRTRSA